MAIKDLIKGCPLFFDLYDEEIEKVLKSQSVMQYQPEDFIIREGQLGDQIFILLEGVAELQKQAKGGTFKIEKFKSGEVFGLLILLDDKPYSIDIIAKTRCSVLEVKHEAIMSLFNKNPRIFAIMTLNICRILGKRLKNAHQRMAEFRIEQQSDAGSEQGQSERRKLA